MTQTLKPPKPAVEQKEPEEQQAAQPMPNTSRTLKTTTNRLRVPGYNLQKVSNTGVLTQDGWHASWQGPIERNGVNQALLIGLDIPYAPDPRILNPEAFLTREVQTNDGPQKLYVRGDSFIALCTEEQYEGFKQDDAAIGQQKLDAEGGKLRVSKIAESPKDENAALLASGVLNDDGSGFKGQE